ncbi:aminopeptidase N [Vallicoccus soli]|uniref:Aminopeptidase N n=1 Tax=Vallicoccus soli TaxID=2339232 RepID=A0A3A3ZLJ9_9ACTN|nr:aminopeptidase N [Vallicoccus soli]RJK97116.1 aminopeptidase N [Vallicoccus soli]
MPGTNLTRDEARERAELLSVSAYEVDLDLTTGETTFRSTTRVRFTAREGASTFVDLIAPTVHEVVLNGTGLDPAAVVADNRIALEGLAAENELLVVADCAYMRTGEGLHRFVDPVDGEAYLYTQFEVADSRRMFAVFEQPDLKATFRFTVTAPAHWEVVSGSPTPEPEQVREGVARWAFEPTLRMSSYITALVAGPYHVERGELTSRDGRTVPLGVFCRRSLAPFLDADEVMDVTRRGFAFFEELFDRAYPFGKYDQLFVPEFNAGAMENAGAVTFLEDYVFRSKVPEATVERRAETILHELAHMWFGDLVTMRWWDDLWLNESFATFASVLCQSEATRWTQAWTTFANAEKGWAYRQDQLSSTHPIAADIRDLEDVEVNFDGITYAKGASVLKQLVAYVGRDAFFEGIRRYFAAHAWGNTTLRDLLVELERTSGRDLAAWSREWLETAGVNTLRPDLSTDADGTISAFAVLQEAPAEHPVLRSHRLAIGLYDREGEHLVRRRRLELDVAGERTEVPELVGERRPDLVLLNDDDLAYAKIRLDERSLETVLGSIATFRDSLPRTLCWAAAWDMTRDAEMAARDYLELVLGGVGTESDSSVVRTLLRQAEAAVALYVAPEHRAEAEQRLADGYEALLRDAAPGSDSQLQLVRAFAGEARSDAQLDLVAGLLDGTQALPGLEVDTDLRWALLHALVEAGRAGEAEVAAELERDNTATGARHAASARAAVPTAEAKRAAWDAVVVRDDLANALQTATIGGFSSRRQRALLEAYVEPYFAVLQEVWATRTNETAQNVVVGLYPTLLASEDLLRRTDAWLAGEDVPPALRRLVQESRDGVARALAAQARDAKR